MTRRASIKLRQLTSRLIKKKRPRSSYSWAVIWVSESRHALSLRRRQTQHKPSLEMGALSSPQTIHPAGFLLRSASIAKRACSIIASGEAVTDEPATGTSRFFLTTPLYQLGGALEMHNVSGVQRTGAARALLASLHMNVARLKLNRGIDRVGAYRAIHLSRARRNGLGAACCFDCHCSILLHPYRRI